MAKTRPTTRPAAQPKARPATATAASSDVSTSMKPKAVIDELRKVVWPTFDELSRMTGIVIVTVLIFATIIGLADYLLAAGVGKIYNAGPSPSITP